MKQLMDEFQKSAKSNQKLDSIADMKVGKEQGSSKFFSSFVIVYYVDCV